MLPITNSSTTARAGLWCSLAMLACLASCNQILSIPDPSLDDPPGDPPQTPDGGAGIPVATCLDAPAGIVAWWDGEVIGQDIVGSFDSTGSNGTPSLAPGLVGNAVQFGAIDVLDFNTAPTPATFTIEGWIFAMNQDPQWLAIFGLVNVAGLHIFDNQLTFWDADFTPTNGPDGNLAQGTKRVFNAWQHVACTWDGTTLRTYVDGTEEASTTVAGSLGLPPAAQMAGATNGNPEVFFGFVGLIDELTVYSRALSDSEIAAIVMARDQGKCKPTQ